MVDNVTLPGTGIPVATDDVGGFQQQRVKVTWGPDGTGNDVDVATGRPLPIQIRSDTGVVVPKAEDVASGAGDFGFPGLAVRRDTPVAGGGVTTDGDYNYLKNDNFGKLWTAGDQIEDIAAATGDRGSSALAVRRDTPVSGAGVSTDGDYAHILLDSFGKLWTAGVQIEDVASATGDRGNSILAVRRDTPLTGAGVSTDGDYANVQLDLFGKLWTTGTYIRNSTAGGSDVGSVSMTVRRDTPASGDAASSNGLYGPMQADSFGKLWTAGAYPEDTASSAGDPGITAHAVRRATPVDQSGTDGDYEPLQISGGALWTRVVSEQVTVQTDVTRPADTTAYVLNDAVSNSTSAPTSGGFTLTGAARVSGGSGIITDAIITSSNPAASGLIAEIVLFDTAVTNINDNAAWAISDTEVKTCVGVIGFFIEGVGNNGICHVQNLSIGFTCVGSANLRFLIRISASAGYTPISAEVITVKLKILQTD